MIPQPAQHIQITLVVGIGCVSLPKVFLNSKFHEMSAIEQDPYAGVQRAVGAVSLLDTDLCKLTKQAVVLEYFPQFQ